MERYAALLALGKLRLIATANYHYTPIRPGGTLKAMTGVGEVAQQLKLSGV